MKPQQTVLYEQPINEQIRLCLRLEQLLDQLNFFIPGEELWHTRVSIDALLEIVNLLDRPDLKSLLAKELSRYYNTLDRLRDLAHIDSQKLRQTLKELEGTMSHLNSYSGKFAHTLRENEFLNSIRIYRVNPGGACHFDVPAYNHWLNLPYKVRAKQLSGWLNELDVVSQTARLLLRLVRDSNAPSTKVATGGLYQMPLDPKVPCQLVRIWLPQDSKVFPEISVGRHRIYVRFLIVSNQGKPLQTSDDIEFQLTCCVL